MFFSAVLPLFFFSCSLLVQTCEVIGDPSFTCVCFGPSNSASLVLGDIVCLNAGAAVPADLRLIQVNELECVQAPLTGEPEPVEKFEYVCCGTEVETRPGFVGV